MNAHQNVLTVVFPITVQNVLMAIILKEYNASKVHLKVHQKSAIVWRTNSKPRISVRSIVTKSVRPATKQEPTVWSVLHFIRKIKKVLVYWRRSHLIWFSKSDPSSTSSEGKESSRCSWQWMTYGCMNITNRSMMGILRWSCRQLGSWNRNSGKS